MADEHAFLVRRRDVEESFHHRAGQSVPVVYDPFEDFTVSFRHCFGLEFAAVVEHGRRPEVPRLELERLIYHLPGRHAEADFPFEFFHWSNVRVVPVNAERRSAEYPLLHGFDEEFLEGSLVLIVAARHFEGAVCERRVHSELDLFGHFGLHGGCIRRGTRIRPGGLRQRGREEKRREYEKNKDTTCLLHRFLL